MSDITDSIVEFSPDEIPDMLPMLCAAVGGDWGEFVAQVQDPANETTMSAAANEICAHVEFACHQLREWAKWLESNE